VATRGFTLVEMMVGLAVLALLAALAAPGFGDYLRDCRRAATVNAIAHALHAARELAGSIGEPVELCASHDGTGCSGGLDWRGSLLLRAVSGDTLRVLPLPRADAGLSVRSNRRAIRVAPLEPSATTATLTVCDDRGAPAARAVIVSRSGRPRIAAEDPSGRALTCT
jgi:type IV fimbrial biogenesis protein FimT